jgi:hypothetical protein
MMMQNSDSHTAPQHNASDKKPFMQTNLPLAVGAAVLILSSGLLGYTVGHRQGLTVVGYDADAEQLVEVVQKQKSELAVLNKSLNTAIQERDVAVSNSNDLYLEMNKAQDAQAQAENIGVLYREVLRQRGGIALAVQHVAIKPLPDNAFEYQLDLMQVSPGKTNASGSAEIRLIQGTEVLTVPMEDKNFNFENNERLTGRWTMPKGFTPNFIEIRLNSAGKQVVRRFSWSKGPAVENQSSFLSEIPQTEANSN